MQAHRSSVVTANHIWNALFIVSAGAGSAPMSKLGATVLDILLALAAKTIRAMPVSFQARSLITDIGTAGARSLDLSTRVCQCHTHSPDRNGRPLMSSSVLSVRLSDEERALLEAASSQARTTLSDFVRRKALEAAEVDVLERRIVTIPAKDWARFEAWAAKPARASAGLKELARRPETWRK